MYKNPEHVGRKYEKVAEIVGARIFRHFLHIVINRLMQQDRLVITPEISMFIGLLKKNPKRVAKVRKKKKIYFANSGRHYGLLLHGFEHEYYFRMPYRRRKQLANLIKEGNRYYNPYPDA